MAITNTYTNPNATYNGDGSTWTDAASPGGVGAFNTSTSWPATAGRRHLIKEGTTLQEGIVCPNTGSFSTPVMYGTYEAGTGRALSICPYIGTPNTGSFRSNPEYEDRAAKIRPPDGTVGMDFSPTSPVKGHQYIDTLDILVTGASTYAITVISSTVAAVRHFRLKNLKVKSANHVGVSGYGIGLDVAQCWFYECGLDALMWKGSYVNAFDNVFTDNDRNGDVGDCIQFIDDGSVNIGICRVERNFMRHNPNSIKQCIIVSSFAGTAWIQDNWLEDCGNTGVDVNASNVHVHRNTIRNAGHGVNISAAGTNFVTRNLMIDVDSGVQHTTGGSVSQINSNTMIARPGSSNSRGICNITTGASRTGTYWTARNNILIGWVYGMAAYGDAVTNSVNSHNLYWNNTTDMTGGDIGSGNVFADPVLKANYRPSSSSPAYRNGYPIGAMLDRAGRLFYMPTPSIGAYEA